MASKTIIIATISEKNGWYNITTNEGIEVSVMAEKCPKLVASLQNAKAGSEVTGNLVEKAVDPTDPSKGLKRYLWDIDEKKGGGGSGKPFTPADKSFTAAQTAAQATGAILALQKDVTFEKFEEMANKVHAWILSKKSA